MKTKHFRLASALIVLLAFCFFIGGCSSETSSGDESETITTTTYYTVTFNSDGGTSVASQTVESGKTATKPKDPTKDGCSFSGWYLNDIAFDFSTAITSNITLTAYWEDATVYCTITYSSSTYGTAPESIKVAENTVLTEFQLPTLTDDNAVFKGWYDGDTKAVAGEYKVTKNVTLTALWSDTASVVYSSIFGTVPTTISVKMNTELTEYNLAEITCSPYTFLGWFYSTDDDNNGTGTQAAVGDKVSTDITLYAKWQTAAISFETQFGATSSITKYTGETISESEISTLTETGYTFSGWFNGSAQLESVFTVSQDLTFTAKWTANKYTVTFKSNGGTGDDTTQTFTFGTPAALNANTFTKTGYTFLGWSVVSTSSTTASTTVDYADVATYTTSASNTTLYAVWKANTYAITFNSNNSSGSTATQSVTYDTTVILNSNPFTYSGYRFTSWNTSADGTGSSYSGGGEFAATSAENIVLYAQWAEADRYIITYKNTKGAENTNPASYRKTVGAALSDLSLAGYIFDGWYDSADSDGNGTGNKVSSWGANEKSGDITLYAKWSPRTDTAYIVEHYQENANDSDYTLKDTDSLTGTTDAKTSATAKSYDYFTAQTVTQGTISADGTTVVKIYYTRNTVTMTFSLAGGTIDSKSSVSISGKYGSSYTAGIPAKTGYTFSAWSPALPETMENGTYTATYTANTDTKYTVYHYQQNADDDNYTLKDTDNLTGTTAEKTAAEAKTYEHFTAQTFSQAEIAADGTTEITIKYDREKITFTLELNGGTLDGETGTIEKTGKYGQTANINAPTKSGYSFEGWNSVGGTIASTYETDTTYTALWCTANSIIVTVQSDEVSVTKTESGNTLTFTAETCTSYVWYLDDEEVSTDQAYTLDTSSLDDGTYTLALEAQKDGKLYSYFAQITVSK